jgi:hypothetical protein
MSTTNIGTLEALLVMRDQLSATIDKVQSSVDKTTKTMQQAAKATDDWSEKQQKAAQRMERMHEEALKMNSELKVTNDTAARTAGSMRLAGDAFDSAAKSIGIQTDAMRVFGPAADVAATGWTGLTKSVVGFNAASIGIAAAGFAIGYMLGGLIRQLPGVAEWADKAAASLLNLFKSQQQIDAEFNATSGIGAFSEKMKKSNEDAIKRRVDDAKAQGQSLKTIMDNNKGISTELAKQLGLTKEQVKLDEKRAAAAEKFAKAHLAFELDEMTSDAAGSKSALSEMAKFTGKPGDALLGGGLATSIDLSKVPGFAIAAAGIEKFAFASDKAAVSFQKMAQKMRDGGASAQTIADALRAVGASGEEAATAIEATTKATFDWAGAIQGAVLLAGAFGDKAGQLVGILGNVQQAFANATTAKEKFNAIAAGVGQLGAMIGGKTGGALQGAAGGAMTGLALGGPVGAVIGGIGGAIMGFLGKKKQLEKELKSMREDFIKTAGGMDALKKKAAEAGVSLDAMFKAKNKDALLSAIDQVKAKLETWDEAHEKLQDAVERYGFTVEELGPKFRQQELDSQAGQLLQDFKLLVASGIDQNLVLDKMSENLSQYVQTAVRAGSTVPEAMRPMIEAAITNGELLDENGQAYASAEAAGITFAQTMSEQFSTLIDKIGDLVAALTGVPNVERTVNVTTNYQTHGSPGGPPADDFSDIPQDQRFASGGSFRVNRPTRILVGEGGSPEDVSIRPAGEGGGMGHVTFAPVFNNDVLATTEARRDLSKAQSEDFFRQVRNSPIYQQTMQRGGVRGRRAR